MKDESSAFTQTDLAGLLAALVDHDRQMLAARLEQASERFAEIGRRVADPAGRVAASEPGWDAHEILAHIAVFSKFYGSVSHRVATGRLTELDLLTNVQERDGVAINLLQASPAELVDSAVADHRRTIEFLRTVEPAALRRGCLIDGHSTMTAEEIARLLLVGHLESHLGQLEAAACQ